MYVHYGRAGDSDILVLNVVLLLFVQLAKHGVYIEIERVLCSESQSDIAFFKHTKQVLVYIENAFTIKNNPL